MQESQSQFRGLTDEEFRTMFLQAANGGIEEANSFFNSFSYAYEIKHRNFSTGLDLGRDLLMRCRSIDKEAYGRIHKGVPFYWLGIAAFLVQDHETATFFYDAAVSEDLKIGVDPINNSTPALHFILIEEDPNHLSRDLIRKVQARIEEELIPDYNNRSERGTTDITLNDIRESFLRLAVSPEHERWRSLATAFISFFIEWDDRNQLLDLRTGTGTAEPFFMHLFKGCVLFESLLKGNPMQTPQNTTLGKILRRELYDRLHISNDLNIEHTNFPTILYELAGANNSIQTAIEFTVKVRNTVGHDLGWVVEIDKQQYHRLFRMVTSSCLHTIACLYR